MAMEKQHGAFIVTVTDLLANGDATFIWKLWSHWLNGLRRRHVAAARETPEDRKLRNAIWAPFTNMDK